MAVFSVAYVAFLTAYMAATLGPGSLANVEAEDATPSPSSTDSQFEDSSSSLSLEEQPEDEHRLSTFMYTFTLLLSAFCCHNTSLPVYERLSRRRRGGGRGGSRSRSTPMKMMMMMMCCVLTALSIASLLYGTVGLAAMSICGKSVQSNVLVNLNVYARSHDAMEERPVLCLAIQLANVAMAACLLLCK
jgi:amino acid permease